MHSWETYVLLYIKSLSLMTNSFVIFWPPCNFEQLVHRHRVKNHKKYSLIFYKMWYRKRNLDMHIKSFSLNFAILNTEFKTRTDLKWKVRKFYFLWLKGIEFWGILTAIFLKYIFALHYNCRFLLWHQFKLENQSIKQQNVLKKIIYLHV